eukprot:6512883-Pyramimonas_sp.AAC.1
MNPTSPLGAGGLGRFPFQPPASPVHDGPRWLQEGLRERKMASKLAQGSGRRVNIASDTHPRGLKAAPR